MACSSTARTTIRGRNQQKRDVDCNDDIDGHRLHGGSAVKKPAIGAANRMTADPYSNAKTDVAGKHESGSRQETHAIAVSSAPGKAEHGLRTTA